jgi:hypothetical protein
VVGKRTGFYYEGSDSGEMAEHFDLKGRECVKDYSEFKDSYGKAHLTFVKIISLTTVKCEQGFRGTYACHLKMLCLN